MSETEPDPGFTFVDKRRRAEEPTPEPPASRPSSPLRDAPPSRPPMSAPVAEPAGRPGASPQPDFASLCVMLYSEALMHLGQVPDPGTGQPHVDPGQARFTIDMLVMLKEKSEGNRTADESALLDELLRTVRMAFVQATRRG